MPNKNIENLKQVCNKTEKKELEIFQKTIVKNLKLYQDASTKANKINLEVSQKSFEEKKQELSNKYFPETTGPSFPSLLSVVDHLDKAGFRISKSKIYRDKDKNQIKINKDNSVLETEVRAYASTLERKEGNLDDLNDIHIQKTTKEVIKLEEQIAKLKFDREKDEGKYILKSDFEAELASRSAIFDIGFRHAFNLHAREWIAIVSGKPDKSAEFLQSLNTVLDEQLTGFASIKTFQVLFQNNEVS